MSATLATTSVPLLRDFGDRFSPFVVKELRQGLRTRFFTTALMLFHFFIVLLLGSVLLEAPVEMVNGIFWGVAGLMLLLVLPLRVFNALNGEAADGTLDMLTLTSIPAFRILQGKWVAVFSQTLLVAGSLLPYMVARYYFGGVEIVRESLALLVLVLGSGIISAALLAFSSQRSVVLRLVLAAGIGGTATPLGFFTAFLVTSNEADFLLREFFAFALWKQAGIFLGILLLAVYVIWYFLALGASRIAPPSENHSTRKRLVVLGAHAVITVIGLLLALSTTRAEGGMFVFAPLMVLTLIASMDVMTEEMPRFPMAVARLRSRGDSGILLGRLLYPGWASGVFFAMVLVCLALVLLGVICLRVSYWDWDDGPFLFMHCLFMAAFVPVVLRLNRTNIFANWWVVQIFMAGAGFLLSMFAGATGARDTAAIGFVTPLTTLFAVPWVTYPSRGPVLFVGSSISLLWLAVVAMRVWANFSTYAALEKEARLLAAPPPSPPPPIPASS